MCSFLTVPRLRRTIRRRVFHAAELFTPKWQGIIRLWASLHAGDTHDLELRHAWNKRNNTPLTKYELLAARYINLEAGASARAGAKAKPIDAPAVADGDAEIAPRRVHAGRAAPSTSGLQLCHRMASRRDKAAGVFAAIIGLRPTSREYWARFKREWAALSQSEQDEYRDLAQQEAAARVSDMRAEAIEAEATVCRRLAQGDDNRSSAAALVLVACRMHMGLSNGGAERVGVIFQDSISDVDFNPFGPPARPVPGL